MTWTDIRRSANSGNQCTFWQDLRQLPQDFYLVFVGLVIGGGVLVVMSAIPRVMIPVLGGAWIAESVLKRMGIDVPAEKHEGR